MALPAPWMSKEVASLLLWSKLSHLPSPFQGHLLHRKTLRLRRRAQPPLKAHSLCITTQHSGIWRAVLGGSHVHCSPTRSVFQMQSSDLQKKELLDNLDGSNMTFLSWGYSLMVEHLISICKVLDLIPCNTQTHTCTQIFPKLIYRFHTIPILISAKLVYDIDKFIINFICKGKKRIANTILKEKSKVRHYRPSNLL